MKSITSFKNLIISSVLIGLSPVSFSQMSDKDASLGGAKVLETLKGINNILNPDKDPKEAVKSKPLKDDGILDNEEINDMKNEVIIKNRGLGRDGRFVNEKGEIYKSGSGNPALNKDVAPEFIKETLGVDTTEQNFHQGKGKTVRNYTLSCFRQPRLGKTFHLDAIQFKETLCLSGGGDGAPGGISTTFCEKGMFGGTCDLKEDNFKIEIPNKGSVQTDFYSYQVNCSINEKKDPRTAKCVISGGLLGNTPNRNESSAESVTSKIKTQGGKDSAVTTSESQVTSKEQLEEFKLIKKDFEKCLKQQQQDREAGKPIKSCDGKTNVSADTNNSSGGSKDPNASKCGASSPECLRKESFERQWNEQCTETYKSTSVKCPYKVDTMKCEVFYDRIAATPIFGPPPKDPKEPTPIVGYECPATWTLEGKFCYKRRDECSPEKKAGWEFAKDYSHVCEKWPESSYCIQYPEYFWKPDQAYRVGSCTPGLYPVEKSIEESCANKGNGVFTECRSPSFWLQDFDNDYCTSFVTRSGGFGGTQTETTIHDERSKFGCGFCDLPFKNDTCRGPKETDDCGLIDKNKCTYTHTSCTDSHSLGAGSVCLAVTHHYRCREVEEACTLFSNSSECKVSANTVGIEKITQKEMDANAQMGDLAVAIGLLRSANTSASGLESLPRIFDGIKRRCRVPRNIVKAVGIGNNCCDINLERPGGSKGTLFQQCDMDEVRLAGARRKARVMPLVHGGLGKWCSKSIKISRFVKVCIEDSYGYCDFNDKISRIIHIQGREQLMKYGTTLGQSVQTGKVSWNYYGASEFGNWKELGTVNGSRFLGWQWPETCKKPTVENNFICPETTETWIAACDDNERCGTLPLNPYFTLGAWGTSQFNALDKETKAISRFALAEGQCASDTAICKYEIKAFPYGQGGRAVISRNANWPIAVAEKMLGQYLVMGNVIVRPELLPETPAGQTSLIVSTDGGDNFQRYVVGHDKEFTIGNTGVSGKIVCQKYLGVCEANFQGVVQVNMKPWGSAENIDCTGFTLPQISALDFGRMDFSEWIEELRKDAKFDIDSNASELVKAQISIYTDDILEDKAREISKDETTKVVRFSHLEGFGPFELTVAVDGNYPKYYAEDSKNNEPVSSVNVDFGNCIPSIAAKKYSLDGKSLDELTPKELAKIDTSKISYRAKYLYPVPNEACKGEMGKDTVHPVKVTITTGKGVYELNQEIINLWKDPNPVAKPKNETQGTIQEKFTDNRKKITKKEALGTLNDLKNDIRKMK